MIADVIELVPYCGNRCYIFNTAALLWHCSSDRHDGPPEQRLYICDINNVLAMETPALLAVELPIASQLNI